MMRRLDRSARGRRDHLPPQGIGSRTQDTRADQVLLCRTPQSFVPVIWKGAERTFHSASSAATVSTKRS
jgi:hypothetical protein